MPPRRTGGARSSIRRRGGRFPRRRESVVSGDAIVPVSSESASPIRRSPKSIPSALTDPSPGWVGASTESLCRTSGDRLPPCRSTRPERRKRCLPALPQPRTRPSTIPCVPRYLDRLFALVRPVRPCSSGTAPVAAPPQVSHGQYTTNWQRITGWAATRWCRVQQVPAEPGVAWSGRVPGIGTGLGQAFHGVGGPLEVRPRLGKPVTRGGSLEPWAMWRRR